MRIFICIPASFIVLWGAQSFAATHASSYSFTASSNVIASCAVDARPLLAHPEAATGSQVRVCAPAGPTAIQSPLARVMLMRDATTGLSMLLVEF